MTDPNVPPPASQPTPPPAAQHSPAQPTAAAADQYPAAAAAPIAPAPPGSPSKVLAILTLVFGGLAVILGFAAPGLAWLPAIAAIVLGIIALVKKTPPRWMAPVGMALAVIGWIIGIVMTFVVIGNAVSDAVKSAAPLSTVEAADPSVSAAPSGNEKASFKDGVLTTPEMKLVITSHKIIPVGQPGNEYGDKPIIVFYYSTTNLTDKQLTPTSAFLFNIEVFQDNDPNSENQLDVGILTDDTYLDSQNENIKKGGTVDDAVAYELDDTTTPVDLVASTDLGITNVGKVTYNLT